MYALSCPYQKNYCGATSSEIIMHPIDRNNILIDIKNYRFIDKSVCYYQLYVPEKDMDTENYNYYMDIQFKKLTNVITMMNNGTSFFTANDPISVTFSTGYDFTYDIGNGQSVFLVFYGTESKLNDPQFTVGVQIITTRKRGSTVIVDPEDPSEGGN